MTSFKARVRRTIYLYLFVIAMALIAVFSMALNKASAGTAGGIYLPPDKDSLPAMAGQSAVIQERYTATMILWYTADGKPHNIFIVDTAHLKLMGNTVIIDRSPIDTPDIFDQVLVGGMFDFQTFGYTQVFSNVSGQWKLNDKFNNFALEFKRKAGEHLGFRKDDRTQ